MTKIEYIIETWYIYHIEVLILLFFFLMLLLSLLLIPIFGVVAILVNKENGVSLKKC